MTVKELIKQLEQFNLSRQVVISYIHKDGYEDCPPPRIYHSDPEFEPLAPVEFVITQEP